MSRLGRERPVSRKDTCRDVELARAARSSWLRLRVWRHCRRRSPNGLTGALTRDAMISTLPRPRVGIHSPIGNRFTGRRRSRWAMTTLRAEVIIDAPAAAVWEVVAHRFDRVGEWATAIASSVPTPGPSLIAQAPVAGRACRTGIAMVPEVTERIIAYDEANHTLTYKGEGLPTFLGSARNQWRVTALDERRTRVGLEATMDVRGVLGRLMYLVLRLQLTRTSPQFLHDLKYYVEHGQPSPRKQRQLRAPHP